MYVTDYNINFEIYRQLPVKLMDIKGAEYYHKNVNGNYSITLTDKAEGTIKGY